MSNIAFERFQQKLAEAADHFATEVLAGRMTETRVAPTWPTSRPRRRRLSSESRTGPVQFKSNDPRKAAPITKTNLELYADSLRRDGMTEKHVLQLVLEAQKAGDVAIHVQVEKERAIQQGEADAIAKRKYNTTPEGIREFAQAKRATDEVNAAKLADAKTVLEAQGFTADDVALLRDDEILRFSGVDPEAATPEAGSHMPPSRFVEG